MGRAGPHDRAVLHLALRPRGLAVLVGLEEHLVDLLHGGHNARVDAAVHLVVPLAEQLVAGSDELRAGGLVDLPLLQLQVGLVVEALHRREVGVPAPLGAGRVLNGLDAGLDVLRGHLHGVLVVQVADGEAEVEHGDIGEAAGKVGGSHGGTVAGHGARNEQGAHVRQRVDDQSAALGGRDGAGVGRQTVALDCVDVGDADQLVDLGDEEHGQQLVRDREQIGEAGRDLTHGHLVEGEEHLVELLAVAVLAVSLGEEDQVLRNVAEDLVGDLVAHTQVGAAQTEDVLVHEAVAAEIGDHPAVPQRAVEGGDEVLGEGHQQHAPHAGPFPEVVGGVLDAAPLAADRGHGALAVETAETALAVDDTVELLAVVEGHEVLVFALDALAVGLEARQGVLAELLPVGLLEHLTEDAHDGLQVFALLFPFNIIFRVPEFRIRVLNLGHYALPPSL